MQWIGSPADEASWEDMASFQDCYPDFHLEDKVNFDGERNDTSPLVEGPRAVVERPILLEEGSNYKREVSPILRKR